MFAELTQSLIDAMKTHGILAVIAGVAIETIIVPLPSPIILMAAGFILIDTNSFFQALLSALWISVVAGAAQTIGSFFVYGIGYVGGKPLIDRYEKYHGVSWKEILVFQKKFEGKREDISLFILRALPIMPLSIVSGVAGVIKLKLKEYTLFTFLGTVPRNLFLAMLGWQLGEIYLTMAESIDNIESVMTVLIVLAVLGYIIGQKTGVFWKLRTSIFK